MTTLDPRGLEEAAEVFGDSIGCPEITERAGVCHGCEGRAEQIITAYLEHAQPVVTTVEELEGLEVGTIILDRFEDESYTRIVGPRWVSWVEQDGLRHTEVALPARVIWRPHESA